MTVWLAGIILVVLLASHRPDFSWVHPAVRQLREKTVGNERPWAIAVDEPGEAEYALVPDAVDPQHDNARMNGLWGALTAAELELPTHLAGIRIKSSSNG